MAKDHSTNNNIVLSFHDSLLRQSDIELLMGPQWLNDNIISFYLEYLEKVLFKDHKQLLFVSPEVTQCIKIITGGIDEASIFLSPLNVNEKTFIFFPINDNENDSIGGSHWSLLVFSRPERKFFHYDSANNSNLRHCRLFILKIKSLLQCSDGDLVVVDCLQQKNGYDCGVHVLGMIQKIAQNIVLTNKVYAADALDDSIIAGKRMEILELIMNLGGELNNLQ